MNDRDTIISQLRNICNSYSDILGMVILFGSFSRNEAVDGSDIDLYIEPKDVSITTARFGASKRYKEFKYELYDSISREFDLLMYGGKRDLSAIRNSMIWEQIQKDGVIIYDQRAKAV